MNKNGEIKLNIGQVNKAISSLKSSEIAMNTSYQKLIQAHVNLKEKWEGKSSKAFVLCSKNMENNLKGRIDSLHAQIVNLEETKQAFIDQDKALFLEK